jgi:phosphoglycerate dehydrogenase-like enzyme
MATTSSASSTAATRRTTNDTADDGLGGTARQVAENVAGAAGEVSARIPEVTRTTRDAWSEANRMVHSGSDATLKLIGATSIGFAVGLLVGGANRLLVLASLIPAALIGATLVERMDGGQSTSQQGSRGANG